MSIILHDFHWFRFINIFLSTFNRLLSISSTTSRDLLLYDITYLKFVRLCADDGFFFVKGLDDDGRLRLVCGSCAARACDINEFLHLLSGAVGNSGFSYTSTSRFSRHARRRLMLFHSKECIYFSDKKNNTNQVYVTKVSQLDAFEIVKQLDRFGLLLLSNASRYIQQKRISHDNNDVVNIACRVCFANRALLASPCGHVFQCINCWCALIRSQHHEPHDEAAILLDNIDTRSLLRSIDKKGSIANILFFGKRYCPVCRCGVFSVQHIFV